MALCGSGYEVESSTVFFSSSPDVPAAQLPELKLLKALTKELRSCVKSATPFHKAVRVVGTDVEKKLRLFPNAILGHDSSTNEWIVKLMPSGAHDVAANLLMAEIVNQYQVANNSNMSAVCYPSGTQTFRLTPTRSKQADQSFCSVARPLNSLPVVVVEVGVSESRTQLVHDACWWLESGHVNLVILIIVRKAPPQSLQVEIWEIGDNSSPSRRQSIPYPCPLQGLAATVPPLVIPYVDLEINLPNALLVPMHNWTTIVWRHLG
ncbi:hypothetical protein B0H13DRAFT_2300891 [Mycena leptocephala]|nr:hypothetical protein B0H13DRAFT_2300891 [Mycena leptocephala]